MEEQESVAAFIEGEIARYKEQIAALGDKITAAEKSSLDDKIAYWEDYKIRNAAALAEESRPGG